METIALAPRRLQFGIYRDGDNNLDASQATVLNQAIDVSARNRRVAFTIEDTTARRGGPLHTDEYDITGGHVTGGTVESAHDMSDPGTLSRFVARTLDDAQRSSATQTWIELVDHGGGDGGGLESDTHAKIMRMPDIAKAISDGIAMHAAAHPEDRDRRVDGVAANQCLMATMGFADALSRAGVRYLAASPETMISPGVPSSVAEAVAQNIGDPRAMASAVVKTVMDKRYFGPGQVFGPAAAFDVLSCEPGKISHAEAAIKRLNDDLVSASKDFGAREAERADARATGGMVRFPRADQLPWRADRSAISFYNTLARDSRLSSSLRGEAQTAKDEVSALVMAHRESTKFAPFGHVDYSDAVGPTIHLPVSAAQLDPWAPRMSECDNAFYKQTDQDKLAAVLA
jgi:hypothetical protein